MWFGAVVLFAAVTTTLEQLAVALTEKYAQESGKLRQLAKNEAVSTGEKKNIDLIGRMAVNLQSVIRRRSGDSVAEVQALAESFVKLGAKAVLKSGSQRGGDFLNNQLRGRWAERVVLSMPVPGYHLIAFGPSGAAMPGEEDHRQTIMTFREIVLLEGKRPDLIAFRAEKWNRLSPEQVARTESWPDRLLDPADEKIVAEAEFGVEVKNSTWHYETRRAAGGGPLSITVKVEEIEDITSWEQKTNLPVLFMQVLFDEIYCMSFARMLGAIRRGHVYAEGDYLLDESTGADGKTYHRFFIPDVTHRCALVEFPSASLAKVRVLHDGSVIPHIDFQPAIAHSVVPDVIREELKHSFKRLASAR